MEKYGVRSCIATLVHDAGPDPNFKFIRIVFIVFSPLALSASEITKVAREIESIADSFCGEYEKYGSSSNVSGEASGMVATDIEIPILKKRLLELGLDGLIGYVETEYFGLLREDLANERLSIRDCRLQIWSNLSGLITLTNVGPNLSSVSASNAEQYNLPLDIRVSKVRSTKILDGTVALHMADVKSWGNRKAVRFYLERPNQGKRLTTISEDRPVVEFEYRNKMYEIELVEANVADQEATIKVLAVE